MRIIEDFEKGEVIINDIRIEGFIAGKNARSVETARFTMKSMILFSVLIAMNGQKKNVPILIVCFVRPGLKSLYRN